MARFERSHAHGKPLHLRVDTSWNPKIVEIHDPVAGFMYVIDDQNKAVHRLALNPPNPFSGDVDFIRRLREAEWLGMVELLGSQSIETARFGRQRRATRFRVGNVVLP